MTKMMQIERLFAFRMVKKLRKEGRSIRQTASFMDLSKSTVGRLSKMRKLAKRAAAKSPTIAKVTVTKQQKEIEKLLLVRDDRNVQTFPSTRAISRELNRKGVAKLSKTTVWRRLRRAGKVS